MGKTRRVGALWLVVCLLAAPAMALQTSRPIATDHRIQTVRYSPNEVYSFLGHYGYQSSILLGDGEEIGTISIGDSVAWMINPSGNRIFLKPIEQNATTNMTVITSKRTYYFELHAEETDNIRDPSMVFDMRFVYPEEDTNALQDFGMFDDMPDIESEPEKYNFNYSVQGSDLISPVRIFDDGEFTYMQFRDTNADVPAIFHVDAAGNEEIQNFRKRGDYIVIERVSNVFTLRYGVDVVCVYNESGVPHGVSREQLEAIRQAQEPSWLERLSPF